jgi:hypothetical protein
MKIIRCKKASDGYEFDTRGYPEYLEKMRGSLPHGAFAFASADWHYSFEDHRCPHDGWVESLQLIERQEGDRYENYRRLEMHVRVLGAYSDVYLDLHYKGVYRSSIVVLPPGGYADHGHGDWLIDEVRLSVRRKVIHEVLFVRGKWLIECDDLIHTCSAVH